MGCRIPTRSTLMIPGEMEYICKRTGTCTSLNSADRRCNTLCYFSLCRYFPEHAWNNLKPLSLAGATQHFCFLYYPNIMSINVSPEDTAIYHFML